MSNLLKIKFYLLNFPFFSGISSLCFTNHGEALYMMSSSEIQRITLSATKVVKPTGSIELEEWDNDERDSVELEPTLDTEEGNENTTMEATTPISAATSDLAVNRMRENIKTHFSKYLLKIIFRAFNKRG